MATGLDWQTLTEFRLGDTTFVAAALGEGRSSADRFFIRKSRGMVTSYAELLDELNPGTIVDLGIYEGACAAFIAAYSRPDRMAAIDIASDFPALESFIVTAGFGDVVSVHGGVDQRNRAELLDAVDRGVGQGPIDLVIDDASHRYFETVASFEALFPRLRVGGRFVIEDWATGLLASDRVQQGLIAALPDLANDQQTLALLHQWVLRHTSAHEDSEALAAIVEVEGLRPGRHQISDALVSHLVTRAQGSADRLRAHLEQFLASVPPRRPFADLVLDLLRLQAFAPKVIARVDATQWWVSVERGSAELDPDGFRLGEHDEYVSHFRY